MGVAQRMDVIVDFRPFAGKTLYFENRLEQFDGRGPTGNTLPAGAGNFIMQFRVKSTGAADNSAHPNTRKRVSRFDERREQARTDAERRQAAALAPAK